MISGFFLAMIGLVLVLVLLLPPLPLPLLLPLVWFPLLSRRVKPLWLIPYVRPPCFARASTFGAACIQTIPHTDTDTTTTTAAAAAAASVLTTTPSITRNDCGTACNVACLLYTSPSPRD